MFEFDEHEVCRVKPSLKRDFNFGLHSNIPLCCVLQWLFEQYVLIPLFKPKGNMLGLPWRGWRYWRDTQEDENGNLPEKAQYWPCSIHTWLIEHGWCEPRKLYICGDGILSKYAIPCPKCKRAA